MKRVKEKITVVKFNLALILFLFSNISFGASKQADTCKGKGLSIYFSHIMPINEKTKKLSYTLLPQFIQKQNAYYDLLHIDSKKHKPASVKVEYKEKTKVSRIKDISYNKSDNIYDIKGFNYGSFLRKNGSFKGLFSIKIFDKNKKMICKWEQKVDPFELTYPNQ